MTCLSPSGAPKPLTHDPRPSMEPGSPARPDPGAFHPGSRTPKSGSSSSGTQPHLSTKRRLEKEEQTPLCKQFLSEENMAIHFSRLSLHNDHPYCTPPAAFPLRNLAPSTGRPPEEGPPSAVGEPHVLPPSLLLTLAPRSELLLWRYPGSLIPEALRLLRFVDPSETQCDDSPAEDTMEL
ncbi:host cell factor C1 regulator 1 isoform X1 [Ornithorhynchus anatinus]|nr:host cell factor C1 regulator 1 isoform X1 [Ornithorhynchus anatinus]